MLKSLSLRQASRRQTQTQSHSAAAGSETVAPLATLPAAAGHHAHTAGGREITGFWGWFERGTLLATLASVALGAWAYLEDRQTRRDEAINRAWSILTTPATGNSGKREALEYLASQGVSLMGIDLSCEKMGGGWDPVEKDCEIPVYLSGLTLSKLSNGAIDLLGANLSGAFLEDAELQNADLWGANLEGTVLWAADLRGASLEEAQMSGVDLSYARLSGANLREAELSNAGLGGSDLSDARLSGADLAGSHISDANFSNATGVEEASFLESWAWSDFPPVGLPEDTNYKLCKWASGQERNLRPDPCIPPD